MTETHFKIRHKTPQKYFLVAKSKTEYKNKARGGVAVYSKANSMFSVDAISTDFNDLILFRIRGSNCTLAAVYIPPTESKYYSHDYFDALDLVCHTFSNNTQFYAFGDLNSRIATPTSSSVMYQPNPDLVVNSHGRNLLDIIGKYNLTLINGLKCRQLTCDTAFTYFKGEKRSQIDLALCNETKHLRAFQVEKICPASDHCPISFSFDVEIQPSLSMVRECSRFSLSHDHLDINKRLPTPVNIRRINPITLIPELEKLSAHLNQNCDLRDVNQFSNELSAGIYNACRSSQTKEKAVLPVPNPNCTSKNIRAISAAHFNLYTWKINSNAPSEEVTEAAMNWWNYQCLSKELEKKEFNTRVNKKWAHCRKNDSRQMWKMIDWKGKSQELPSATLEPSCVHSYFKGIFQSDKTLGHPRISDIRDEVSTYRSGPHPLNEPISMDEMNEVLKDVGNGTGIDGIPPTISNLLPTSLRETLLRFLQVVFGYGPYPSPWSIQLLFPIEKKGHTVLDPKLRGIAVSSLAPRVYDTIMTNRFNSVYKPNKEQSGFRELQGCDFQWFFVVLLLETAREEQKDLYLLLVDYEKAFDFANRATIVKDMMKHNMGDTFVRAVADMYEENYYIPRIDRSMLGEPIQTVYGVTQGRRSSTSFFSFLICDMGKAINAINYNDFMEPHNMAQMADDTIVAAEQPNSLGGKFKSVQSFSDDKGQSINIDKTLYIHMSTTPNTQTITCGDGVKIASLELGKSSPYLGNHLYHTNILHDIILYNINKRMFNVAKYKAWLDVNESTPFSIKLLVLDNCVLNAILHGCKAWGDISALAPKLESIELDLLKSALGVKKGTPTDTIYQELNRGSIVNKIMDRQYAFVHKLDQISEEEALVVCFWNKSQHLRIAEYYNNLDNSNYVRNKTDRVCSLTVSVKTKDIRYRELVGIGQNNCLYDSYVNDSYRTILTRWRLSNFDLAIETGRYERPKVDREQRLCRTCLVKEDEEHVFFSCPLYTDIRRDHPHIFNETSSVKTILNPPNTDLLYETATVLFAIEKTHKKFNL